MASVGRLTRAAALGLGCAGLAAFTASQIQLFLRLSGDDAPWSRLFWGQLLGWLLWVALLPIVLGMARRYPFDRSRIVRVTLAHVLAAVAVALGHTLLRAATLPLVIGRAPLDWPREIVFLFSTYFHWNLLIYLAIVSIYHAWRGVELRTRLVAAERDALRAQLHPHFLFNALQSVAELIDVDRRRAERVVLELSALLRSSIAHGRHDDVRLEEEIDLVARYLSVESVRFEDRLRVSWDVEAAALEARVPPLLLQPLIENAVRHGVARAPEGASLAITARRRRERLEISVADDGPGFSDEAGEGLGLHNVRARLVHLYGAQQSFSLTGRPGGGAVAALVIPYRTGAA